MAALPTTALLALSAGNTATGFVGDRRAATIAQQQGNAQGALYDQNATLADAQAADAIARGSQNASQVARQGRMVGGAQTAAYAAQGLDTSSGSPAAVMANDRALSALDALTIQNNAAREAWGYKTEAAGYTAQGQRARASGANTAAGYRQQAVGTLLNGAGEMMDILQKAPKGVTTSAVPSTPGAASTNGLPKLRSLPPTFQSPGMIPRMP